jgi:filamentous hemagglutinin
MFLEIRDTTRGAVRNISKDPGVDIAVQSALKNTFASPQHQADTNAIVSQLRGRTRQSDISGRTIRFKSGLDLDLTSVTKNISLGKNLFNGQQSVTINIGDDSKTFSAGSLVSAAEYIAVKQVLSGRGQQLSIDKAGRAIGGSVDLDAITGTNDVMRAAHYVNAEGVTTTGDFSKRSEFKLLGNLNNFGSVIADAGSLKARTGAIRADEINNYRGATISSNIDLTLDAAGSLTNAGTIGSTGSLTINAGKSIANSGSISAVSCLNLNSGVVRNQGTLTSTHGNINLNAPQDVVLEVNNRGGTINALNGAINLREASYSGAANSFLTGGGDLFSKELNMNAGQGTAWVDVNELTGQVNQTGAAAHVIASTEVMTIGNVCLTGDPTYFNTNGSIVVNDNLTVSEKLVIAASGNVFSIGSLNISAGLDSQGFDITMIAGADFKNTGGFNKTTLGNTNLGGAGAIRLTGKSSKTGGSILLDPNTQVSSRATNSSGAKNGGNVQLFAFEGKGIEGIIGGIVDFQGASISTGGNGTGTNGNLLIVAGAPTAQLGVTVLAGQINTTGGSGGGGNVTIITADPVVSVSGSTVTYDQNGNRTSTASLVQADKVNGKAGIAILGTVTSPTSVTLTAGDRIIVNNVISGSQTATLSAGGDIIENTNGNSVQATNLVTLNSGGNIGSNLLPLTVNGPHLEFTAKGSAKIDSANNGAWLVGGSVPKGDIVITADNANFSGTSIIAKTIDIQANAFTHFDELKGSNGVSLIANGGTIFSNNTFAQLSAPNLAITTGGSVGTGAVPFVLPANTTLVFAVSSGGGAINLIGSNSKTVEFNSLAGSNVKVSNTGSTLLSGNTFASGTFTAIASNGTITVDGDISSIGAQTYTSSGENGKLTISKNTALFGASTITISVGAATATPMPTPDNVIIDGNVLLTGNEIKAKKPESTIDGAPGRQITINNGNAKGAVSFGGDIIISTDN